VPGNRAIKRYGDVLSGETLSDLQDRTPATPLIDPEVTPTRAC
jgi:hypothetical protein